MERFHCSKFFGALPLSLLTGLVRHCYFLLTYTARHCNVSWKYLDPRKRELNQIGGSSYDEVAIMDLLMQSAMEPLYSGHAL